MGKVWKHVSGLHRTPRELAFCPREYNLAKVRSQQPYRKRMLPCGQLAATILEILAKAKGDALHATVISRQVLAKHGLPPDRAGQKRARRSVISTLNELRSQGRVERLPRGTCPISRRPCGTRGA